MDTAVARRRLLAAALCSGFGGAAGAAPVLRLVVAGAAGSALDQYARRLAGPMGRHLGRTVVVDDRPGGSGLIALDAVARARPDGGTLLLAGLNALCIAPVLDARRRRDPRRELAPVSLVAVGYPLLLARLGLAAATLAELVALDRRGGEPLRCGAPALASVQHLAARQIELRSGLRLQHVAYVSQPQVLTDLIGGHLDVAIEFPSAATPLVTSGRLRALAVLGPTRKPALPDVPTAAEQGLDAIEAGGWLGLLGPAGLPAAQAQRIDVAVQAALDEPAVSAWIQANGSERMAPGPAAFQRHLDTELGRWGRLVAAAGLMPG